MKLKDILLEITRYTLFVDLDGVLTDFDRQFESFGHGTPDEYEKKNGQEMFWQLIKGGGLEWWSQMQRKEGGRKLWDYIKGNIDVRLL